MILFRINTGRDWPVIGSGKNLGMIDREIFRIADRLMFDGGGGPGLVMLHVRLYGFAETDGRQKDQGQLGPFFNSMPCHDNTPL